MQECDYLRWLSSEGGSVLGGLPSLRPNVPNRKREFQTRNREHIGHPDFASLRIQFTSVAAFPNIYRTSKYIQKAVRLINPKIL